MGISNRMQWTLKHYSLTKEASLLQLAAIGFDISIWEMMFPLLCGGRLVIPNSKSIKNIEYLANIIESQRVSIIHCVPSLLNTILDNVSYKKLSSIKEIVCGGEVISRKLHSRVLNLLSVTMYHAYGPTEAAISVTHWQSNKLSSIEPPI